MLGCLGLGLALIGLDLDTGGTVLIAEVSMF